ncbi:YciI family protein [Streptomyces sp. NPDC101062]|uniref:YciI family protein n=1 Tax=unclassified Streptomyces TaxID=2593676 RepID=UPI002E7A0EE9|nr:YciI family protein [Streptomyces sp. JV176]MEE1803940.1 YciI family protein [Streptomyces sp. JV176]
MPRYLSLVRIDEATAPAGGPSPELQQRMGALLEEITKAGVMLDTAGLTPTSDGVRVRHHGGTTTVTDGPFTEAKEVIGGYALMQAKDKAEAVEWARRFVEVHEDEYDVTCEVRQIAE